MIRFTADARSFFERATKITQDDALPILEFLSTGFEVPRFGEQRPRLWWAIIKPDVHLRNHFGLTKEYFVIGHGFPRDFHQSTLLAEPPPDQSYRIDPQLRFVASTSALAVSACQAWALQRKIAVVLVDPSDLPDGSSAEASLYKILSKSLWRRDLFDDSEPVRSAAEFFGREAVVSEVVARVLAGTPVAIFGLRKIGKSSLMRRAEDLLLRDESSVCGTAFLLGNSSRLKSGRWWDVLRDALETWRNCLDEFAKKHQSKVRPKLEKLPQVIGSPRDRENPAIVARAFEADLERLLKVARNLARETDRPGVRLVLFLDEADELYPHLPDAGYWREDFFHLWNSVQSAKRRLADPTELTYVLGGVNPSGAEQGSLLERANPLFEVSRKYLAPMTLVEGANLLRGFGARMGLVFEDSAVEQAYSLVGGHPWLLRKMGSAVHLNDLDRGSSKNVSGALVQKVFEKSRRDFYAHVHWILDHLRRVAPEEARLLTDIAEGGADKFLGEWGSVEFRDTFAHHLEKYGLVDFSGELPQIALSLVKDALRRPSANTEDEQTNALLREMSSLEETVRVRLVTDLAVHREQYEAVDAIVEAIPKEGANRPKGREELRELGKTAGLRALVEALNWSDYETILSKFADEITWSGVAQPPDARRKQIHDAIEIGHLARHKNSTALRKRAAEHGFDALLAQLTSVREMLTADA